MALARIVCFATIVYLSFRVGNLTPLFIESEQTPIRPKIVEQTGNKNANEQFADCCEHSPVGPPCKGMCNFDLLSKNKIMVILTSKLCSPTTMLYCATSGENHIDCCRSKNVHKIGNTNMERCLDFCDMSSGNTIKIGYGHLGCWRKLDLIKECFQEYMTSQPNGCDRIRRSEQNC